MMSRRAVAELVAGFGITVLVAASVGVAAASLSPTHAAAIDLLVSDLGSARVTDSALVRAGVDASAVAQVREAPLLPGGEAALGRVRRAAARRAHTSPDRIAEQVHVSDSSEAKSFDYDKPEIRRLTFEARAPQVGTARTLAVAVATAYVGQRSAFYAARATVLGRRAARNSDARIAVLGAAIERDRLKMVRSSIAMSHPASPQPVRDAVMAGLVCLGLLALVQVRKWPAR